MDEEMEEKKKKMDEKKEAEKKEDHDNLLDMYKQLMIKDKENKNKFLTKLDEEILKSNFLNEVKHEGRDDDKFIVDDVMAQLKMDIVYDPASLSKISVNDIKSIYHTLGGNALTNKAAMITYIEQRLNDNEYKPSSYQTDTKFIRKSIAKQMVKDSDSIEKLDRNKLVKYIKYYGIPFKKTMTKEEMLEELYKSEKYINDHQQIALKKLKPLSDRAIASRKAGLESNPHYMPNASASERVGYGLKSKAKLKISKDKGIREAPIDRFTPFGKHLLHYPKLHEGVFNLRYQSGANHKKFPISNISKDYKDFMIDFIENKAINNKLFHLLPQLDQTHFKNLLRETGLSNQFKVKTNNESEEK
jgi:hypothetical protein